MNTQITFVNNGFIPVLAVGEIFLFSLVCPCKVFKTTGLHLLSGPYSTIHGLHRWSRLQLEDFLLFPVLSTLAAETLSPWTSFPSCPVYTDPSGEESILSYPSCTEHTAFFQYCLHWLLKGCLSAPQLPSCCPVTVNIAPKTIYPFIPFSLTSTSAPRSGLWNSQM